MRILITGGAGLVGSHVADYYAKRANEVIVLDNLMRSQLFGCDKKSVEYNWQWLSRHPNVRLIKGDVRNEEDVNRAIGKRVDVVIHAAGQPGIPLSIRIPKEDFDINAFGTLNVLECVRQKCPDATFIYCSTNKVYGENVNKVLLEEQKTRYVYKEISGISEEMPIDYAGHTPYGVSKCAGDLYTQEYARIYGMKTGVFRMSCIYGIRQFGFEDQGWIAWLTIAILSGKPITIYGDGKQVRDLLYVDDLVQAYDFFIRSDIKHGIWNIGGGAENTVSLNESIEFLEKETGKKTKISFSDWRLSDQKVYISDISKINKELRWKPHISPENGCKTLITWIKEHITLF